MPFLGSVSACLAAAINTEDLVENRIHLLGACQLSGAHCLIGLCGRYTAVAV